MKKTHAPAAITPAYLSLKEAAAYLGMGLSSAQRDWVSWEKFGVIPSFPVREQRRSRPPAVLSPGRA